MCGEVASMERKIAGKRTLKDGGLARKYSRSLKKSRVVRLITTSKRPNSIGT